MSKRPCPAGHEDDPFPPLEEWLARLDEATAVGLGDRGCARRSSESPPGSSAAGPDAAPAVFSVAEDSVARMPACAPDNLQGAFYHKVIAKFGPGSITPGEALACGGHPDTRQFDDVRGHPIWETVEAQIVVADGLVLHPFVVMDPALHEGVTSRLKAAVEQRRRAVLHQRYQSIKEEVAARSVDDMCECEMVVPMESAWGNDPVPACCRDFWLALRWMHGSHPSRQLYTGRLSAQGWLAVCLREPNPVQAAALYFQNCHGAVLCQIPSGMKPMPRPAPKKGDDKNAEFFAQCLRDGVAAGTHLLESRARQDDRFCAELDGKETLCVNPQFAVAQDDKVREITDSSGQSNAVCLSRGAVYPTVLRHVERLVARGCGADGSRRVQYKLDIKSAFTHVHLRPDQLRLTAVDGLDEVWLGENGEVHVRRTGKSCRYYILCAPFGFKNSPAVWLELPLALVRRLILLGAVTARVFVDDGFGSGPKEGVWQDAIVEGELSAERALSLWQTLCEVTQLVVAQHKVFLGVDLELLGVAVLNSTNEMRRGVKNARHVDESAREVMSSVFVRGGRRYCRLLPMQRMVSTARWSHFVVPCCAAFLCVCTRLVAHEKHKLSRVTDRTHVLFPDMAEEEVHFALWIAPLVDGAPIRPVVRPMVSAVDVGADASYNVDLVLGAYGYQVRGRFMYGRFPREWLKRMKHLSGGQRQLIALLELWTVVRLVEVFGEELAGFEVQFAEDNTGVESWVGRMSGAKTVAQAGMLKSLAMMCQVHDIRLVPVGTRSRANVIPDMLSSLCNEHRSGDVPFEERLAMMWVVARRWADVTGWQGGVSVEADDQPGNHWVEVADRLPLYTRLGWPVPSASLSN